MACALLVYACGDPLPPGVGGSTGGTGSTTGDTDDTAGTGGTSGTGGTGIVDLPDVEVPEVTTTGGDQDVDVEEPPPDVNDPGGPGWPCISNSDCDADWCVDTQDGKKCSELCVDKCTLVGWGCKKAQTLGEDVLICLPLFPHLCEPCNTDEECSAGVGDIGDKCVARDDGQGSFCGGDCSTGVACPDGYECLDIDFGAGGGIKQQCVPLDGIGECTCTDAAIAREASTNCTTSNDFGTCDGVRICGAEGLTSCSAAEPVAEICDEPDNDCDGETDEEGAEGCLTYFKDFDSDGFGVETDSKCLCAPDIVYKAVEAGDCDDGKAQIGPGQLELCNEIDDDCDEEIDEEDALGCKDYFADADKDDWGDEDDLKCLCIPDEVHNSKKPGDCDDEDPITYPAAPETCSGKDTNCDGQVAPEGTPGCQDYYLDADDDGFGSPSDKKCLCAPDAPYAATENTDCNDNVAAIAPEADEFCDLVDNDCDGATDEADAIDCVVYFKDADKDAFGNPDDTQCLCGPTGAYTSLVADDCNDALASISPDSPEACNNVDDDCDLAVDEADASGCEIFYKDSDEDGFGTEDFACLCDAEAPYTATQQGDCDDELDELAPDKPELCNDGGADNDCDGLTDEEGAQGCITYFLDSDADGYGTETSKCLCAPTGSFNAELSGDCADNDKQVSPKATEVCDAGVDNDCDGLTDEADAIQCETFYEDLDKDGFGVEASSKCLCGPTFPYLAGKPGDCKDGNEDINPDALEQCGDGVNNNCNGQADEEDALGCTTFFQDVDGDEFGVLGTEKCLCAAAGQWTASKGGDCDDKELLIFPGAECAPAVCEGATLTSANICTGAGVCEGGVTAPCPGGFKCSIDNQTCKDNCVADKECIDGNFCVAGKCSGKKPDGSQCFDDTQCVAGTCNNGFCCSAPDGQTCCGGSDQHCSDNNGCTIDTCNDAFQCQHISDEGAVCKDPSCDQNTFTAAFTCTAGVCLGGGDQSECNGDDPCKVYSCTLAGCAEDDANKGTLCIPQSCEGSTVTAATSCNTEGECASGGFSSPCAGGFKCADAFGCLTSCLADADCQSTHYCADAQCLPKKGDGSPCNEKKECQNAFCNNGFCCSGGECCGGKDSDCDDGSTCTTDSCLPTFTCVHQNNSSQCQPGSCKGLSYTQPKFCSAGLCSTEVVTEWCGGNNKCLVYNCTAVDGCVEGPLPVGNVCENPKCSGWKITAAKACDGAGGCLFGGSTKSCPGGYTCANADTCKTSCFADEDCQPGLYCEAAFCLPKRPAGDPCSLASQCLSDYCNNGYCCADGQCCSKKSDCDDQNVCTTDKCSAQFKCTTTANNFAECKAGKCNGLSYTNPKTCLSNACTEGGDDVACTGTNPCLIYGCGVDGCTVAFAPDGTVCAPVSCGAGYIFTASKSCNGQGACANGGGTAPCPGGFVCEDAATCASSCSDDAGCRPGWYCEPGGTCQPKRANGDACVADNQCLANHCDNGFCCPGVGKCCATDANCDDGNLCTTDVCQGSNICAYSGNSETCQAAFCEGLTYNFAKSCNSKQCIAGGGIQNCQGSNPCKNYSCNTATGCVIENSLPGTQCATQTCNGFAVTAPLTCDGFGDCAVGGGTSVCPGGFACQNASQCYTVCGDSTHCAPDFYCSTGACQPKRANGDACTLGDQCTSNYCANGYCCGGPSGSCCNQDFHCNDSNQCTTDVCTPGKKCTFTDNSILCKSATCDGLTFTANTFCSGGSCSAGGATEACGGTNSCQNFACTTGGCQTTNAASGVQCEAQSCAGNVLTQAKVCNGGGLCTAGGEVAACPGGFLCADQSSCKTSCATNADCHASFYCQNTLCLPLRANGDTCAQSVQCSSGYCANGYCCDSGGGSPKCCGGSNAHCDDSNACTTNTCLSSVCQTVNNTTQCATSSCSGVTYTSPKLCLDGGCTVGGTETQCVSTNPCRTSQCTTTGCLLTDIAAGTPCGAGSCVDFTLTSAKSCNGSGTCASNAADGPCPGGFKCADDETCLSTCTGDAQCQDGYFCNGTSCELKKINSAQCAAANECASNYCNNGYCCDSGKCCQTNTHCDDSNVCTDETCVNFSCSSTNNTQICQAGSCSGLTYTEPRVCAAGACPGSSNTQECAGGNSCKAYSCSPTGCASPNQPLGTQCLPAECIGFQLTQAKSCNGGGTCSLGGQTAPCANNLTCADATSCRTSCSVDTDCVTGFYCAANQCLAKKTNGSTCSGGSECVSAYCNSNLCCAGGTCCTTEAHCDDGELCTTETCNNNQCTVTNNNLLCAASGCVGLIHTAVKTCSGGTCSLGGGTSDCSGTNPCRVYSCAGAGCSDLAAVAGTQCQIASCVDGVLTQAKTCDGGGNCTSGGTVGPCSGNYACLSSTECRGNCTADSHCQSGNYCEAGSCISKKTNGAACSGANQCQSGYCANGFCCQAGACCAQDTDCGDANTCTTDTCQNNQCVFTPNQAQCAAGSCAGLIYTAPQTCDAGACTAGGATSDCSGTDSCKAYSCTASGCGVANQPSGTQCAPAACTGNQLTTAKQCDGTGGCTSGGVTGPCSGSYVCKNSTQCNTTCTDSSDCVSGFYCQGGACLPKLADGLTCTASNQCNSGHCNNFVCCSGGTCCSNAASCGDGNSCTTDTCVNFSCQNTNNTAQCAASQCSGLTWTAPKFCLDGACTNGGNNTDCSGANACLTYVCSNLNGCSTTPKDAGEVCTPSSCAGTTFTPAGICNGNGSCSPSAPQNCDDGDVCTGAETCNTTTGCVAGNPNAVFICGDGVCNPTCETATSCPGDCKCVPGYTVASGEFDSFNTGGSGGTNKLSKYGGSCTGDYVGSEYAYTFVAPLTGQMKVTLGGADSNTDVLVLAEAANGCDPADCVAQGQGTGSTVTWSAVAGSTYYIVVDRKVAGSANYTLYLHYTAGTCHIPFIETWNRTPFPRAWTLEANWQTSQDSPFGATHAKFTGTPTLTNFERSLTSPVFDTTACPNTQLTVDWRAVPNGSDEGVVMHIEVSSSGGAVWSEIFTYDTTDAEQPPITQVIQSTVLANTALARVRLRITGNTSANLNKIQVDNVKVNAP